MNWPALGGIATAVGVIGSLLFAGVESRRSKNRTARAEAAARLSESYTARVVDSLERIATAGPTGVPQIPSRVRWTMTHQSGDTFLLTNSGEAKAYHVQLAGDPTLAGPDVTAGGPDLADGEALTFTAGQTYGTRDSTITVTWSSAAESNDRSVWRYPLPSIR